MAPAIRSGRRIVVAAHGNSIRALVKYLDGISDADIVGLNIPNGIPLVYELDDDLRPLRSYYLGDAEGRGKGRGRCRGPGKRLKATSADTAWNQYQQIGSKLQYWFAPHCRQSQDTSKWAKNSRPPVGLQRASSPAFSPPFRCKLSRAVRWLLCRWKNSSNSRPSSALVRADYVEPVDEKKLISDAISGMVAGLDPHSQYFDKKSFKEFKEGTSGRFVGVGIEISQEDGLIKVVSPIEGSPAFRAGLKPNDLITKIDDTAVRGLSLNEAVKRMRGEAAQGCYSLHLPQGREPHLPCHDHAGRKSARNPCAAR